MKASIWNKHEAHYLEEIHRYPDKVILALENADAEGLAYFETDEYLESPQGIELDIGEIMSHFSWMERGKLLKMMVQCKPKTSKGIKEGFTDITYLLDELENKEARCRDTNQLLESYPNIIIWNELCDYAWNTWGVVMGFTHLPQALIFKDKGVLFPYTLVCIQEMDHRKIAMAPGIDTGVEVQRIYMTLGMAVNDIAKWLRENHSIDCHANHPLGGLINTPPLAAKAGLGWQGHSGLLVTPEFGQRQRIAPIFVESKVFEYTDSKEHRWIESFCETCQRCEKMCPAGAIYGEKQENIKGVEGIDSTRTCINKEKCYEKFNVTMGCSVCVKVCPFSAGTGAYDKIKDKWRKQNENNESKQSIM